MTTILALSAISIIPLGIITLFSKNRAFFQKKSIIGFGLGVYAALIILLLIEATEHSIGEGLGWFVIGLMVSFVIGLLFKNFHHHHDSNDSHKHTKSGVVKILISDFFHNIVDGISVITSFAVSPTIGVTSFLGILGHQTVQQAGQQVLLTQSGSTPKKALLVSFLISLSIFLGFIFLGNEQIEIAFIGISAGTITWKVLQDAHHTKWEKNSITGFIIGVLLLTVSLLAIPHAH